MAGAAADTYDGRAIVSFQQLIVKNNNAVGAGKKGKKKKSVPSLYWKVAKVFLFFLVLLVCVFLTMCFVVMIYEYMYWSPQPTVPEVLFRERAEYGLLFWASFFAAIFGTWYNYGWVVGEASAPLPTKPIPSLTRFDIEDNGILLIYKGKTLDILKWKEIGKIYFDADRTHHETHLEDLKLSGAHSLRFLDLLKRLVEFDTPAAKRQKVNGSDGIRFVCSGVFGSAKARKEARAYQIAIPARFFYSKSEHFPVHRFFEEALYQRTKTVIEARGGVRR